MYKETKKENKSQNNESAMVMNATPVKTELQSVLQLNVPY